MKRYKTLDSQRLAKMLPAELREAFDKLYLQELADLIEDKERLTKELVKTEKGLKKLSLKEGLRELARQIEELEEREELTKGEKNKLKKLPEQFRDLSAQLSQLEAE